MRRDEGGFATLEFIVIFAFGALMAAGLYVTTAWPATITAASAAAYEAARAAVEAPTQESGEAEGRLRAEETMANHGYDGGVAVAYTVAGRGEAMEARVTIELPVLRFPGLGQWDAMPWTTTRVVRVPDFRSVS